MPNGSVVNITDPLGGGAVPAVLPVPLPAERRNVDRDFEHLAGRLRLRVRQAGTELVNDESSLAALEVGSTDHERAVDLAGQFGAPRHGPPTYRSPGQLRRSPEAIMRPSRALPCRHGARSAPASESTLNRQIPRAHICRFRLRRNLPLSRRVPVHHLRWPPPAAAWPGAGGGCSPVEQRPGRFLEVSLERERKRERKRERLIA